MVWQSCEQNYFYFLFFFFLREEMLRFSFVNEIKRYWIFHMRHHSKTPKYFMITAMRVHTKPQVWITRTQKSPYMYRSLFLPETQLVSPLPLERPGSSWLGRQWLWRRASCSWVWADQWDEPSESPWVLPWAGHLELVFLPWSLGQRRQHDPHQRDSQNLKASTAIHYDHATKNDAIIMYNP